MPRPGPLMLGIALAAGGLLSAAPLAAAGDSGIPVYTWTDANGVKHFSDVPRHQGSAKKIVLPTPAPPDQTAIAALQAWLQQLHRQTQADLAEQAARRQAERRREAEETSVTQSQALPQQPVQYLPIFFPPRRYHRWRHHRVGPQVKLPSAKFPANALPSSFPEEPSFWPPGR